MSRYRVWSIVTVALLLGVVIPLTAACSGPSVNEQQNTSPSTASPSTASPSTASPSTASPSTDGAAQVSLGDVLSSPNDFYGKTVTTEGKVAEVLSSLMFDLDNSTGEAFNDPDRNNRDPSGLTIVNNTPGSPKPTVAVGQTVTVTGMVRELDVNEIEADTGLDLSLSKFAKRSGTVSLVAESIEVTGGGTTAP